MERETRSQSQRSSLTAMQSKCVNRLKLADISEKESPFDVPEGFYIEVRMLWTSGVCVNNYFGGRVVSVCHFILADDSGHISAKVYLNRSNQHDGENICRRLKKIAANEVLRIVGFEVIDEKYDPSTPGMEQHYSLLRQQAKSIKLSASTKNIFPCEGNPSGFLSHIPFVFTDFMGLDQIQPDTISVDIIGYVESITEREYGDAGTPYRQVLIRSSVDKNDGYQRKIALFGEQMDAVKKTEAVYAFGNLPLSEFNRNVTLKATDRSFIIEVDTDNVARLLPPKYHQDPLIRALFPVEEPDSLSSADTEIIVEGSRSSQSGDDQSDRDSEPSSSITVSPAKRRRVST